MPRIIYGVALLRIAAWFILITFCVVCFEYSVAELNRIIRKSRPHFEGLTIDQTRDFLIVYLIFGVIYILIDGKWFYCCNTSIPIRIVCLFGGGSQITFASLGGWVVQNLEKLQTLKYKIANF